MKDLKDSLRYARKHLKRVARNLPNQDAYCTVYSVLSDLSIAIDTALKELGPAVKEAQRELKENPVQSESRAKKWCRKP